MLRSELIVYRDVYLNWLNNARNRGGSFVSSFAKAALAADLDNLSIIQPALSQLIEKYPEYDKE